MNSPFSPGSDNIPLVWAGRTVEMSDWHQVVRPRRIAGLPERGRTFLGEPGLGKSTLVRRIARDAAAAGDWITPQLRIPSGTDAMRAVATAVVDLARQAGLSASNEVRIRQMIDRVTSISLAGFALSVNRANSPEPHTVLTELLIEVGKAAVARGDVAVLIHIDEVQNITDENILSQLLIALGDAITYEYVVNVVGGVSVSRSLPIAVYLTGLPEFGDMSAARKGATFTRRFKTEVLEPLSEPDLEAALQPFLIDGWTVADGSGGLVRIHMDEGARDAILALSCGEPFLLQLAGEQAWYADQGVLITEDHVLAGWRKVQREAGAHVERILQRLPSRERQLLEAMAQLDPIDRTLTKIATAMGHERASDAGPTSQRLDSTRGIISRGKPYTFRHRAVEAYLTTDWPDAGPSRS